MGCVCHTHTFPFLIGCFVKDGIMQPIHSYFSATPLGGCLLLAEQISQSVPHPHVTPTMFWFLLAPLICGGRD